MALKGVAGIRADAGDIFDALQVLTDDSPSAGIHGIQFFELGQADGGHYIIHVIFISGNSDFIMPVHGFILRKPVRRLGPPRRQVFFGRKGCPDATSKKIGR